MSSKKRKQKEFGARYVEPRQSRSIQPLCFMLGIIFIALSLILCWCRSQEQISRAFLQSVFSTLFYLLCAKELYLMVRQWMVGLTFKRSNKDHLLFVGFIPGIIAILSERDEDMSVQHTLIQSLLVACLLGGEITIFFVSKINRNKVNVVRTLEREPSAVGPGLAIVFSTYLENVINGKCGSPRCTEAINEYRKREGILEDKDGKDWILKKVMILFPEAKEARGSVEELVRRHNNQEKAMGRVNYRLCFEKIKHEYQVNGQIRESWCEVLKIYNEDVRGYVVIAENRPLNTLYAMLEQKVISEEMFKIQFHVYKNELERILDEIEGCNGNYEFFHYRDNKRRDFGRAVIAKIISLRRQELN